MWVAASLIPLSASFDFFDLFFFYWAVFTPASLSGRSFYSCSNDNKWRFLRSQSTPSMARSACGDLFFWFLKFRLHLISSNQQLSCLLYQAPSDPLTKVIWPITRKLSLITGQPRQDQKAGISSGRTVRHGIVKTIPTTRHRWVTIPATGQW